MSIRSINPIAGAIIGVAGVLATAATSAWCALRTKSAMDEAHNQGELTKNEKIALYAKGYLPAGVCIAATSAVIVAFGTTNAKQATALAGTYAMLNKGYGKHKAEIKKLCTPLLDKDEREKLAKKYFEKKDKEEEDLTEEDDGKMIFFEEHYDGFFRAKLEDVIYAEYQINRIMAYQGYATINDFYDALNMDKVEDGDLLGWCYWDGESSDPDYLHWIDSCHEEFDLEDGMTATRIIFDKPPAPYDMDEITRNLQLV